MLEQSSISSNVSAELCSDTRFVLNRSSSSSSAVSGELFDSSEEFLYNSELADDTSEAHTALGTLDNDKSCFHSDHTLIQDSMTECTGLRNIDVASSISYHDLDSNETSAAFSIVQQNYDSTDSLQYEEFNRQFQNTDLSCSDLLSNPGCMNYSDLMCEIPKIAASNAQPEFLSQTYCEYLPEECNKTLEHGENENGSESSLYSRNTSEAELLDRKCNNQSENINVPGNNGQGSSDKLFDVLSSYVAMLDWSNNDTVLPETIADGQNEVVEIHVFDDVDHTDGKNVDGFQGANGDCREIDLLTNKCEETTHTGVESEESIDLVQEEYVEGDSSLVYSNATTINVKSELNVVTDDKNVYLPCVGMSDWVDLRPDKYEGDMEELYNNSTECDVSLKACNTNVTLLNSTNISADYQYGQDNSDHILEVNNYHANNQHDSTVYFDSPGQQMDTVCSGQIVNTPGGQMDTVCSGQIVNFPGGQMDTVCSGQIVNTPGGQMDTVCSGQIVNTPGGQMDTVCSGQIVNTPGGQMDAVCSGQIVNTPGGQMDTVCSGQIVNTPGGQMDAVCSGQNVEMMTQFHSHDTAEQHNDMKVCTSTSSQRNRLSDLALKTLRSLVESKRPGRIRKRKGKEICVKLPDNFIDRDTILHRLKIGKFGKRPHVVRITPNRVLFDVTQEYLVYLPCRIKH